MALAGCAGVFIGLDSLYADLTEAREKTRSPVDYHQPRRATSVVSAGI
jgi:hypothetical protein